MKATIGIIGIFFLIFSCKKEKIASKIFGKKCEQKFTLDSLSTSKLLIGSWKWIGSYSHNYKDPIIEKADKNVIITFLSDGNYSVSADSKIVDSGKLKLKNYGNKSTWQIDLQGFSQIYEYNRYLYGVITFCENQLSLDNTPLDGSKNLFERIN